MKRIVALTLSLVMFLTQPFSCALAAINLPANLKSIQTEAFAGVPMTYIVVDNAETELADGALEDARIIVGRADSPAQHYAQASGKQFFNLQSLTWIDGFAYLRHEDHAELAFPQRSDHESVLIPSTVAGYPVTAVGPYAFTDLSSLTHVQLPQAAYDAMPEEGARVNWPTDVQFEAVEESYLNAWLDEDAFTMYVGDLRQLPLNVDCNEPLTGIRFASSDEGIVSVSAQGMMSAVAPGTAEITCRIATANNSVTLAAVVTVPNFTATLSPSSLTLTVGEAAYVKPSVTVEEGFWVNDQRTGFWSANESVVTVDHLGMVTAVAPGSTWITYEAYTFYGDHRMIATCPVTVLPVESGLTLNASEITLLPYETFQLEATGADEITWSTSHPDLLSVENGLVTALNRDINADSVTVSVIATATVNGAETSAVCSVTLLPSVVNILYAPNYYTLALGDEIPLQYALSVKDPELKYTLEFTTTDENIAAIDENGMITAVGAGKCMVRLNVLDENGKLLCTGGAYVYVDTDLPSLAGESVSLWQDHYFFVAPEDGEVFYESFGLTLSDEELGIYNDPCFTYTSDPEGAFTMDEYGNFQVHGEGTAQIHVTLKPHDESIVVPDTFQGDSAIVTIGNPWLEIMVSDANGENAAPLSEENPIDVGDRVTITLKGVPEDIQHNWTNWDYDEHLLYEIDKTETSLTLIAQRPGDMNLRMDTETANGAWFELYEYIEINGEESEFQFEESVVSMVIGEDAWLWPGFDWEEGSFTFTDESIVKQGDRFPQIVAVGAGTTVVTADVYNNERNEWVELSTIVHVRETGSWELKGWGDFYNISVMQVGALYGESHGQYAHIECTYREWPDYWYSTSDDSILRADFDEDAHKWTLVPLKPGVVTLTITVEKDGEVQSLSKPITVVEPAVYFQRLYADVRVGSTVIIPLVNTTGKEISSIIYTSEDAGLVAVEDAAAEYGAPAMKAIGVKDNNSTRAFASVTFEDGSEAYATIQLEPTSEEVWIDIHAHESYFDLVDTDESWADGEHTATLELWWDTNASMPTDPNRLGSDTARIEWYVDGEQIGVGFNNDIVELIGFDENAVWNNCPIFMGVGEGGVDIEARMVVMDKDGNDIAEDRKNFHIEVHHAYVNLWFEEEAYTLNVGEGRHLPTTYDFSHAHNSWASVQSTDNPDIAYFDTHGNLYAVAPGETNIHETVNINGHQFTATAHVVVQGVELRFHEDYVELNEGEHLQLIVHETACGNTIHDRWWTTSDPGIVQVREDGTIYAVGAGSALIYYNINTDYGHNSIPCLVTVHGEAPAFRLDQSYIELWPEDTAKLSIVSDFDVPEGSFTFTSTNENQVAVDHEGNVTAIYCDRENEYQFVTCTAEVEGQTYTASCLVMLKPRNVRICEDQFGEGAWESRNVGDTLEIWETISFANPNVQVDVTYTSDDEDIAYYDSEAGVFRCVSEGVTTLYCNVTVWQNGQPTGEDYVRPLRLYVGQYAPKPESFSLITGLKDTSAVYLQAHGERFDFGIDWEPEYSGRHLILHSENPEIAEVYENEFSVFPRNPGSTTITIFCEEFPEVSLSFEVHVLDLHVAAEGESNVFAPGDNIHLILEDQDGNLFQSDAIESVHFDAPGHSDEYVQFRNGNILNCGYWEHDNLVIRAWITFKNGQTLEVYTAENAISMRTSQDDPFFFLCFDSQPQIREYVGVVGTSHRIDLNTNCDFAFLDAVTYTSGDTSVVTMDRFDNLITCVGAGETEITAAIEYNSKVYTVTFPVRVIEPEPLDFQISPHGSVVKQGEILQLYISYNNDITFAPNHYFNSLNTDVLEPVYERDEEGNILYFDDGTPITVYGQFYAKNTGSAVITAKAYMGQDENAANAFPTYDQATFYVIPNDPTVYLDESYIELRPDQQVIVPLHIDTEGTGRTVSSIAYAVDNTALATVEALTLSGDKPAAKLLGLSAEEDTHLTATVTFDDGSQIFANCNINMIANDEVWVDAHSHEVWLSTDDWSGITREVVWQSWTHNASHYDEDGMGTDKAWIDWWIDDENIATFDGQFVRGDGSHAPWNNGMMLKAVSAGETTLHTHLVLTDKDGNFLAEDWADYPVIVTGSELEVWMDEDEYELNVGENGYVYWNYRTNLTIEPDWIRMHSDNESVAVIDSNNFVYAAGPGDATIYVTVCVGGHEMTASAHVRVNGVELRLYQNDIHVGQGETANIILFENDNGIGTYNPRWITSDASVATVDQNGVVVGVAPGKAVITYAIDTDYQYQEIQCLVTVHGEDTGFTLNYDGVDLWPEQSADLDIVASGNVESIEWNSSNEDLVTVDDNGQITVVGFDSARDTFVTVTAHATMDGQARSATCVVKVMKPNAVICEYQFGREDHWESTNIGGWIGMWEEYRLLNPNFDVKVDVTVDPLEDGTVIAEYDAERELIGCFKAGVTQVHYTITLYQNGEPTGESYTRSLTLYVGQETQTEAAWQTHTPKIAWLRDGGAWLDVWESPQGTWAEKRFYSRNPEILTFDNPNDAWMTLHDVGRAEVEVVFPGSEHLNFVAEVIVIDEERIELRPVDDRENPYLVRTNETVQLGFFMDGQPFDWFGYEDVITYELPRHYDPDYLIVDENLTLTTLYRDFGEEIHHWVYVLFPGGERMHIAYKFRIDSETPYFYATVTGEDHMTSLVGNIGDNRDITFCTNMDEEELEITYVSGNDEIVTMADNFYTLVGLGETVITVTATRGDEVYESIVPVKVIEPAYPQEFHIISDNYSYVFHVGDIFQLWAGHEGENTLPPDHSFSSSDQRIFRPVCYEAEDGWLVLVDGVYVEFDGNIHEGMTRYNDLYGQFEAMATGSAVITVTGHYGHDENAIWVSDSATFYVINHEPKVFLSEPYVELRPDETAILPLCYHDNGTDWVIESVSYAVENPEYASVEEYFLDTGASAAKLTGIKAESGQDTSVTATVTFTNGNQLTTTTYINMIANDEVWVDSWVTPRELWLFANEDGTPGEDIIGYNADVVWTLWNHNASHYDEEGMGSDKAWIEWWIDGVAMGEEGFGSGIVEFVEFHLDDDGSGDIVPWNNGPIFRALAPGEVTIKSHLVLFDKNAETDENGKPLHEEDILAEDTDEQILRVREAHMDLWVDRDELTMHVAQEANPGWNWHEENTPVTEKIEYLSSDDGVVYVNADGDLFSVAPGEATVTMRHTFEHGVTREVSVHVTVVGATAAWADEAMYSLSLTPGQSAVLTPSVTIPEEICFATNSYWENTNPSVVALEEVDGVMTVKALSAGTAVVSFWQNLEYYTGNENETEWGECFVYSTITVTDENNVFTLNQTTAAIAGDTRIQLEPVYDVEALGEPVSITWSTAGDNCAHVDDSGLVWCDPVHRTFHTAVICTAEFADGSTYKASCLVTINRPVIRPCDYQYGNGQWQFMELNTVMGFWDCYEQLDSSVYVNRDFWVINEQSNDTLQDNPRVVTVDSGTGYITSYDLTGSADVVMYLKVYRDGEFTGESYVRYLHVRVNEDTFPEDIEPSYEVFVVPYHWNQHYLPLDFYPQYTHADVECYSHSEEILTFDEGVGSTEMYFHGRSGRVPIEVICPQNEDLSTWAEVLVINEDALELNEVNGRHILHPGETVQLVPTMEGMHLTDREIHHIEWHNYYSEDQFILSDSGELTVVRDFGDPGEEFEIYAEVFFNDGSYSHHVRYAFQILPIRIEQEYLELRPGQTAIVPLSIDLADSGRTVADIEHWIDNSDLVVYGLHQDENGGYYLELTGLDAYESTNLHVKLILDDGSQIEVYMHIHMVPNEEVWIGAYTYGFELGLEDWGYAPTSAAVWLNWDTNAALSDSDRPGTDTMTVHWSIDNPSVAYLDGWYTDEEGNRPAWDNGPIVVAAQPGDALLEAHIELWDEHGNWLTDTWAHFPIHVLEASAYLEAPEDTLVMRPGQGQFVDWRMDCSNTIDAAWVDEIADPSVATIDVHGNVNAILPGETTLTRSLYVQGVDEPLARATMNIVVEGPDIRVPETIEMTVGQQMPISDYFSQVSIDLNGLGSDGDSISVGNGHVLSYENGVLTAHQPGKSNLFWDVSISDWDNQWIRYATEVIVTGEAPFTLNQTIADLAYGESIQLTPVYDLALGELEEIHWESYWEEISVTDDGLVTAHSRSNKDESGTIHCWAVIGGEYYDATCEVTARTQKLRPIEWQFTSGDFRRIYTLNVGDEVRFEDCYELADPSVEVSQKFKIYGQNMIYEDFRFKAVAEGSSTVEWVLTASNGESYTLRADFHVGLKEEDIGISSISAADEYFTAELDWNQLYFPLTTDPANVPLNVHPTGGDGGKINLEYRSSDKNVVAFSEGNGEMYFKGSGRATVEAFREDLGLYASMDVLILDPSQLYITAYSHKSEEPASKIYSDRMNRLIIQSHDGVLWNEDEVDHIDWEYDQDFLTIETDEDGIVIADTTGSFKNQRGVITAHVYLKNGYSVSISTEFLFVYIPL